MQAQVSTLPPLPAGINPTSTITVEDFSKKHGFSIAYSRKMIANGALKCIVMNPGTRRKKYRILAVHEWEFLNAHYVAPTESSGG